MITEGEVENMKEEIAGQRRLLRSLHKLLTTINPERAPRKSVRQDELAKNVVTILDLGAIS